jgi:hypothetical protein
VTPHWQCSNKSSLRVIHATLVGTILDNSRLDECNATICDTDNEEIYEHITSTTMDTERNISFHAR